MVTIKANLSINYFHRARHTTDLFQEYLQEINLDKKPISEIKVRDVQLFLNRFMTMSIKSKEVVALKKELPKSISFRALAKEKVMARFLVNNLIKKFLLLLTKESINYIIYKGCKI